METRFLRVCFPSLYILALAGCCISCGGGKVNRDTVSSEFALQNRSEIKVIDIGTAADLKTSDLVATSTFIKLESSERSFLGEISKCISHHDTLFVLDKQHTKAVYAFHVSGKFLFKVGTLGEAPGQYRSISDFTIVPQARHVAILDDRRQRLVVYDFTGKLIKDFDIPKETQVGVSQILYSNGRYFLYTNYTCIDASNCHNLIVTDLDGNTQVKEMRVPSKLENFGVYDSYNLSSSGDTVIYFNYTEDIIYFISNNQIWAKYKIDFGGMKPDQFAVDISADNIEDVYSNASVNAYTLGVSYCSASKKFLIGRFTVFQRGVGFFVYDRHRSRVKWSTRIASDSLGLLSTTIVGSEGNRVFCSFPSEMIDRMRVGFEKEPDYEEAYRIGTANYGKRFMDVVVNSKLNDNPILAVYEIRDN